MGTTTYPCGCGSLANVAGGALDISTGDFTIAFWSELYGVNESDWNSGNWVVTPLTGTPILKYTDGEKETAGNWHSSFMVYYAGKNGTINGGDRIYVDGTYYNGVIWRVGTATEAYTYNVLVGGVWKTYTNTAGNRVLYCPMENFTYVGTFNHIAIQRRDTEISIYFNGVKKGYGTLVGSTECLPADIASHPNWSLYFGNPNLYSW